MKKTNARATYALDSMALPLPYAPVSKSSPLVFRLMVTLKEEIDPAVLEQAVRDLAPRFPIMYTRLRRGFLWGQLEDAADCVAVRRDEGYACRPFEIYKEEEALLRVLYRERGIAVECSHLTCDGYSGTVYLNSLAARYLELRSYAIEKSCNVLDCRDRPAEGELEDSYWAAYRRMPKRHNGMVAPPAFQCLQERKPDYLQVTRLDIPIDKLKRLIAEQYAGCSITQYLCAVYAYAFLQLYEKNPNPKKPVRLSVSTNLRNFWDTRSLRNFVGMTHVRVEMGRRDYGFRDVLAVVRGEMEERLTREKQLELVCQNLRHLDSFAAKLVPGFVKQAGISLVLPLARRFWWPHTSTISNVGYIRLPPSLSKHIESYVFHIGEMDACRITCAAAGVNNTMALVFSAVNESTVIQDFCADFLRREGLISTQPSRSSISATPR